MRGDSGYVDQTILKKVGVHLLFLRKKGMSTVRGMSIPPLSTTTCELEDAHQ